MFKTLNYIWNQFWKRPSKRGFLIFTRMLKTEIKCLIMTGYSTDELIKQSGLVQGRFESDGRSWMSGSSLYQGSIP